MAELRAALARLEWRDAQLSRDTRAIGAPGLGVPRVQSGWDVNGIWARKLDAQAALLTQAMRDANTPRGPGHKASQGPCGLAKAVGGGSRPNTAAPPP
eukprot:COSAG05_NODE_11849_length_493_cov_1.164975_1_plen_97_part_10